MSLPPGSRLGVYELVGPIGAGGMGEVYHARDTKLNRDVALKVLPELFATDPDRLARFKREAQVLASLNHPNIAAIYGFEDGPADLDSARAGEGGHYGSLVHALVLELVEGPTLADRIAQGPMPLDEALPIARQIAEALEAAHEHGVMHRDLKPANIKVRPDGTVKVLDFGLAKAFEAEPASSAALSMSPTITSPAATRVGMILGTAAYMSPEQARGKTVDKRSDIWAFGCVLYEMLTGRRPFEGEDVTDVLARVLERDPDFKAISPTISPAIRRLLRRCLEKDRKRRLPDIGVARIEIDEALTTPAGMETAAAAAPRSAKRERLLWAAAVLMVAAIAAATAYYMRAAPVDAPEMRLQIVTPPGFISSFAISPDGLKVVYQASVDGKTQLWLRALEQADAQPLAGTEDASGPFWSPDSQWVGFSQRAQLKRVGIAGGTPLTVVDSRPAGFGGTWSPGNVILFAPTNTAPLFRVPSTGGTPVEATRLDSPRQVAHRFPHFLPDGRHFLFFATGAPGVQGIYIGSLDSMDAERLIDSDTAAVFAPPDYVLFGRQDTLLAQRLDLGTLKPVGEPQPVVEGIALAPNTAAGVALSASIAGPVAYRTATQSPRQLFWFDRSGKQIGVVGAPDPTLSGVELSPDSRTVAVSRRIGGNGDIWLIEVARGVVERFTSDAAADQSARWSPDGSRIAFHSARRGGGRYDLYVKSVTSGGNETVLLESSENKNMLDWSPDGRFLLYASQNPPAIGRDIWAVPLDGDRKPFVVVQTAFSEQGGRFSPDSRWIAYESNETGRNEIYARPFPGPGRSVRVSINGGQQPRWRGDAREIFYLAPDDRVMAVPIAPQTGGAGIDAGTAVPLFSLRVGSGYDPSPDGQRFLLNMPLEDDSTPPITILLNWAGARQGR